MNPRSTGNRRSLPEAILVATLGSAACILLGIFFLLVVTPAPWAGNIDAELDSSLAPMLEALAPEAVANRQAEIVSFGSRLPGQPGYERTIDHFRKAFIDSGLELHEISFPVVTPLADRREILEIAEGTAMPLPETEVFPLMPNAVQPVVTPEGGLDGELVLLSPEALRSRKSFDDVIGLIDAREGAFDPELAFAWQRYARLGIRALIVSHPDGLGAIPWEQVHPPDRRHGMSGSAPVNYVRLAATPGIFQHLGKTLRLHVDTRMRTVAATNLVAFLRAPVPSSEAAIITTMADAYAVLPDHAPGVLNAISPALTLQLLDGLSQYRDELTRDIIFFVSGSSFAAFKGENEFIKVLGLNSPTDRNPMVRWIRDTFLEDERETLAGGPASFLVQVEEDRLRHAGRLAHVEAIRRVAGSDGFLVRPEPSRDALASLDREARDFFDAQYDHVVDTLSLEFQERVLQARIALERLERADPGSPELQAYLTAKSAADRAAAVATRNPLNLLEDNPGDAVRYDLAGRFQRRMDHLLEHHRAALDTIAREQELARQVGRYERMVAFETTLVPVRENASSPAPERLSMNVEGSRSNTEPGARSIQRILAVSAERLGKERPVDIPELRKVQGDFIDQFINPFPLYDANMWRTFGYPHFHFLSLGRRGSFLHFASPDDEPWMRDLSSLRESLRVLGRTFLLVAQGQGDFSSVGHRGYRAGPRDRFSGRVLASGVGQSIVPDYPVENALVFPKTVTRNSGWSAHGRYDLLITTTDPYGEFNELRPTADYMDWSAWYARTRRHSPLAATFGEDGLIHYIKDEGPDGQRLFKSTNVSQRSDITIVVFRASPVTILDLTNPRTLTEFTGVENVTAEGLAAFRKQCIFEDLGLHTTFLPPDERFVTLLKAGVPGNELVQEIRAFMLNPPESADPENEHPGFLVADHPVITQTAAESARSLVTVNDRRLGLQNRYDMADARTNRYQERSADLLADAAQSDAPLRETARIYNESATYGMLNHPVLRESVYESVVGILWYLGLLVPFVFFAEKLIFSFNDVRRQIAAQSIIFLGVFALLRLLHPAFQMIRSSLMILLGFVIILIAGGITILFSGKFSENFAELRKRQGKFAGTDVNALGVTLTAFNLGLNNMNRRKLRTGLTCATLSLLTFVMISFTSVSNPLRDTSLPLGKAAYQGFLVKRDRFFPVRESELVALKEMYGEQHRVTERRFWVGGKSNFAGINENPRIEAIVRNADGYERRHTFNTVLKFQHDEPLRDQIRFVTQNRWLPEIDDETSGGALPVLIPDESANILGIDPARVDAGEVTISLNGVRFRVHAIFEAESLDNLRDLDGAPMLPFDITLVDDVIVASGESGAGSLAPDDAPRLPAASAVIAPVANLGIRPAAPSNERLASVAVNFPGLPYPDASALIEDYLVRVGEPTYYGIDGVAYQGEIRRATTLTGLVDLLIPLIIAAMTVLNTMRGSVYERRDEIYVYNAVGVAPRYIFYMFFAEAFVYCVIGALSGYLLSQGTGRILTELGLTGGLRMTYTGISTIYASLTIAAAVLFSTFFPARDAMRIASPADDSGWTIPEPEDDVIAFDLPFLFNPRERFAILEFFDRFFREHGEGSAGEFFCGIPDFAIEEMPPSESAGEPELVPVLRCTAWLKPFDLGVSQRVTIDLPTDPETGRYVARVSLTRLSGTRSAWERNNKPFIARIRRHFLHWRAVPDADRAQLQGIGQAKLAEAAGVAGVA